MVKRKRFVSLLLLLVLLGTLFVTPVWATKEEDGTEPTQSTESTEPPSETTPENAFGEPSDFMTKDLLFDRESNKPFIVVQDRSGNIFYIIIDYDAPVDESQEQYKTYFLNPVDLEDLQGLTDNNEAFPTTCTCTDKCEAGEVNTACSVCKNDLKGCTGKERPAETEELAQTEPPKKDNGSAGTIIFIIVALLAVGGVGYYVKIVRPKQQAEDDEDFEDDGYGEGFDPDEAYGEPEYLSEDDFDDKDSK